MTKEFYFIRHAVPINDVGSFHLSVFNKDMLGEVDESLSEKGKRQARELADTIQRLNIECIVSSTLKRAIETAGVISSETGIPYDHHFEQLVEVVLGNYPLKDNALIRILMSKRWSRQVRKILDPKLSTGLTIYHFIQWYRVKTVGGESFSEIYQKVDEILQMLNSFPEERIAVVGHGGWIFFLTIKLLGESLLNFVKHSWVDNCTLTRVDSNGIGTYQLKYFSKSPKMIFKHTQ